MEPQLFQIFRRSVSITERYRRIVRWTMSIRFVVFIVSIARCFYMRLKIWSFPQSSLCGGSFGVVKIVWMIAKKKDIYLSAYPIDNRGSLEDVRLMFSIFCCRTKLYQLSKCLEVQDFVRYVDYRFYQNLVTVLVPDVLRSIPSK